MDCDENEEVSDNASPCPNTCQERNAEITCVGELSRDCVCKPGFVRSNFKCVPISECGCVYEKNYYQVIEKLLTKHLRYHTHLR